MGDLPDAMRDSIWKAAHRTPAVEARAAVGPDAAGTPETASGLDRLLTSPALLEEFFRRRSRLGRFPGEAGDDGRLRELAPAELADLVWKRLFLDRQPLSEAARIVLTSLGLFGIDTSLRDPRAIRERLDAIPPRERLEKSLRLANLELVLYPVNFPGLEAEGGDNAPPPPRHPAFRPILSLTRLLGEWKESAKHLRRLGFGVKARIDEFVPLELRRALAAETASLNPAALALAWPDGATADDEGAGRLLRESVLPLCREKRLALFLAGDHEAGRLRMLWEDNPDIRFLLFPSRPGGGTIAAPFAGCPRNLLIAGPVRPLSRPAAFAGFLDDGLAALGTDFHACHSEAERPEELAGRWAHLRWRLGEALIRRYGELWRTGWRFSEEEVGNDAAALLGGNLKAVLGI